VLWLRLDSPMSNQAYFVLQYMFGGGEHKFHLNDEFGYMYLDKNLIVPENEDKINMIQQVLDIEVLPNDKYYGEN
jgi:hypothetical protein